MNLSSEYKYKSLILFNLDSKYYISSRCYFIQVLDIIQFKF